MRTVLIGVLTFVLGVGAAIGGLRAYQWKRYSDERTRLAESAARYLFGPSGVIGPDGREVSRQELIDSYMHGVIERSPDFHFAPDPGGSAK